MSSRLCVAGAVCARSNSVLLYADPRAMILAVVSECPKDPAEGRKLVEKKGNRLLKVI